MFNHHQDARFIPGERCCRCHDSHPQNLFLVGSIDTPTGVGCNFLVDGLPAAHFELVLVTYCRQMPLAVGQNPFQGVLVFLGCPFGISRGNAELALWMWPSRPKTTRLGCGPDP